MRLTNRVDCYLATHIFYDLQFSNTEMSPEHDHDKLTRLDVACVLDSGEQVDVEVQVTNEKNMSRRTLYYWAQMYLISLPAGKTYRNLKPRITINLVNFSFLPQEAPHAVYGIYNLDNGHQLTKDLAIHFLEIPKYAKQEKKPISEISKMERWLAYFANQLDRKGKEELAMSEVAIQNAMEAARIFLNNTAERRLYINREMARMDRESQLEDAHEDGVISTNIYNLTNLMDKQHLSLSEAMDILGVPENLREIICEKMEKHSS